MERFPEGKLREVARWVALVDREAIGRHDWSLDARASTYDNTATQKLGEPDLPLVSAIAG